MSPESRGTKTVPIRPQRLPPYLHDKADLQPGHVRVFKCSMSIDSACMDAHYIYIHTPLYACMYVCMYVCLCVCLYMYAHTNAQMYKRTPPASILKARLTFCSRLAGPTAQKGAEAAEGRSG